MMALIPTCYFMHVSLSLTACWLYFWYRVDVRNTMKSLSLQVVTNFYEFFGLFFNFGQFVQHRYVFFLQILLALQISEPFPDLCNNIRQLVKGNLHV